MAELIIKLRDGEEKSIVAENDRSIMDAISNEGVDELLALCGGCCSCATCHVYIDDEHLAQLPVMSELENDLLDSTSHRTKNSRLSCQLMVGDELNGMRVTIAPED